MVAAVLAARSEKAAAPAWAAAMSGTTSENWTLVHFVRRAEQEALNQSAAS